MDPNHLGGLAGEAGQAEGKPSAGGEPGGTPGLHVAALAIGTFVLVLVLMWILMG